MMRIVAFSTAVFLTLVAATVPGRRHSALPPPPPITQLDARRSFVITDLALLQGFTFQRVLDQLVARGGVPNLTTAQLYRQWFDTQNQKPGMADPDGPHCDDFTTNGSPSFNGFPRRCPTLEGMLAASPFTSTEYFPIGLVNRFDQAPADGSNCGQFRTSSPGGHQPLSGSTSSSNRCSAIRILRQDWRGVARWRSSGPD